MVWCSGAMLGLWTGGVLMLIRGLDYCVLGGVASLAWYWSVPGASLGFSVVCGLV